MKFFADEMLGKLARWLRMAGLDVAYSRQIADAELLHRAREEGRIILTRDTRLARGLQSGEFLFISFDHLPEQLKEFFAAFPQARGEHQPLTRCVECNSLLLPIEKEKVRDRVWPYVFQTQEHFTLCPSCDRIYWEATHVKRIQEKLNLLMGE